MDAGLHNLTDSATHFSDGRTTIFRMFREELDLQMRRMHLQCYFITHTRRVDLKGDLVLEYLVLHQGEGGGVAGGFLAEVRGHEVSDQDTKCPFGAVITFKCHSQGQDLCTGLLFSGFWDVVEDRREKISLFFAGVV